MARWPFILLAFPVLSGCVSLSRPPAPVGETAAPTRVEAGVKVPAATPTAGTYTVRKGDTLFGIAREHGLNPRDLAAWNNLDNNNRIVVGQQLRLAPPGAAVPATPAPSGTKEAGVTEVRPIAASGPVVARQLDGVPAATQETAPTAGAVPPAPTLANSTDTLKRAPKGGKLPYSEENLARLKAEEGAPVAVAAPPAVPTVAAAPVEKPATEKNAPGNGNIDWAWPAGGKLLANFSEGAAGAQEISKGLDIAGRIGEPVLAAAAGKVIYVGQMNKYGNLVIVLHGDGYSSVYAHNSRILVKEGQQVARGQKLAELGDSDADQPKLHFEIRQQGRPVDPLRFLPAR